MATKIKIKQSSVAGNLPSGVSTDPAYIEQGELAINTADKILYSKDSSGTIFAVTSGSGGSSSVEISDAVPTSPSAGDLWIDSASMSLNAYYDDGSSSQWVGISGSGGGGGSGGFNGAMDAHIIPDTDNTYDIGSAEYKIRDLYVSENSLWVGDNHKITTSGGKKKTKKRKTGKTPKKIYDALIGEGKPFPTETELKNKFKEEIHDPLPTADPALDPGHANFHPPMHHWLHFAITNGMGGAVNPENIFDDTDDFEEEAVGGLTDLSDVDLTTTAPEADQVLKYDGTNWIPGIGGGSGGTTNLTAGVIWDNHDSTRAEHDVALSVAADATLALTHSADTEELRSVYIEKFVEVAGNSYTPSTTKLVVQSSLTDNVGLISITNSGVALSSAQQKWTGYDSLAFPLSSSLSVPIATGTDDFTIEFWAYTTSVPTYTHYWDSRTSDGNPNGFAIATNPGNWAIHSTGFVINGASAPVLNVWQHVAFVKSGNNHMLFVDGSQQGATWVSSTDFSNTPAKVGGYYASDGYPFNGYMDDLIVSVGVAKYTASFTPPTSRYEVTYSVASTYWQLESFDDWDVRFTDQYTTTLINNTTADAVIRARITKPTSVSTNAYGALALEKADGTSISATAGLPFLVDGVEAIKHTADESNLRSVYIEKFVEVPGGLAMTKKIVITATVGLAGGYKTAFGGMNFYNSTGGLISITNITNVSPLSSTFSGGTITASNMDTADWPTYYLLGSIIGGSTGSYNYYFGTNEPSAVITIEFDTPIVIGSFDVITNPWHYSGSRGANLSIQFLDENLTEFSVVSVPEQTAIGTAENHSTNTPTLVGSTYWQLETYNDWGVQFTDPETTTITNNTGSDATARFRITAPTAAASGSGGGATTLAELTDSTTATTDPLITSNLTVGHFWINSTSGEAYVCTDATAGANVWTNIGGGVGGVGLTEMTGGTTSTYSVGGASYKSHVFTGSGSFTVTSAGDADVLLVAGGGAGSSGTNGGAGGGAGGVIQQVVALSAGTSYSFSIGAGGTGIHSVAQSDIGGNGENSTFSTLTAIGGGAGGKWGSTVSLRNGQDGGSGGGGAEMQGGSGTTSGGAGYSGQGYDGGGSSASFGGSGGGGAGAVGGSPTTNNGADGGIGLANDYATGADQYYAGGGGGHGDVPNTNTNGAGGLGGGGDIASGVGGGVNTGGGGGGGGYYAGHSPGNGGSGILIVRYAI